MQELVLKRTEADKRILELAGVGKLHWVSKLKGHMTAEAASGTWDLHRRGFLNGSSVALDAAGNEVALCWQQERSIRYAGRVFPIEHFAKEPYVLWGDADPARELVRFQDGPWRPTGNTITVLDEELIQREPLLLLYGCYAVNWLFAIGWGAAAASSGVVGEDPKRKKGQGRAGTAK